MILFDALSPLLVTNLAAPWSDQIYSVDASFWGLGVCTTRVPLEEVKKAGRHAERWRFQSEHHVKARRVFDEGHDSHDMPFVPYGPVSSCNQVQGPVPRIDPFHDMLVVVTLHLIVKIRPLIISSRSLSMLSTGLGKLYALSNGVSSSPFRSLNIVRG